MIFDASTLPMPLRLTTDLCVVGSGAGGLTAAAVAAENGVRTLVLEAGEFVPPSRMTQREEEMFPRLFWEGGGRTTADRAVKIHQGHGVGGSTLHNINLCKRIPKRIREGWARAWGLSALDSSVWDSLYDEVEKTLGVVEIPELERSRHNKLLEAGTQALGWRGGPLQHNRKGCIGSGFCEVGCRYNAKNNAAKVFLPRALAAGAEVITLCQATRLVLRGDSAVGVEAVALDPQTRRPLGRVEIACQRVCLSASATGSAALLIRSGVKDPSGRTGNGLRIHPGVAVAGMFDEPVRAFDGIPQSYECTELLDLEKDGGHRLWILPAFAHPVGTATMAPGQGALHRSFMERYAHLGVFTAMLHDLTSGRVRPKGEVGLEIDYWPDGVDRQELSLGLWACAKLLFAAGAKRVVVPASRSLVFDHPTQVDSLKQLEIEKGLLDLTAVHPMSTVPMGDDPQAAPVGSDGRHHQLKNLWVADGSLFPTSIGVPPQISIYAMGLHVGRALSR